MLAIRMRRQGAKKRPYYRVVVIDSQDPRDGRALEVLGHYNPTTIPELFELDRERLEYWVARGARPSDTVRTLLARQLRGVQAPSEASVAAPLSPDPPATKNTSVDQSDEDSAEVKES